MHIPDHQLDYVSALIDIFDPPLRQRKLDNRNAFKQLCFVLRTGASWKDVPVSGVSFHAVYKRFMHWVNLGALQSVWRCLLNEYAEAKLSSDPGWFKDMFIDTTQIKNVAGVDCVGRNPTDRGRKGTKVSVLCDSDRVVVSCVHYPSNQADCKTVNDTVNAVNVALKTDNRRTIHIVGDKAYSTENIREFLRDRKMRQITESKRNAKKQRVLTAAEKRKLQKRHVVENLFCRLKQFKRIRNRFDALSSVFEAEVQTAFCIMLLDRLEKMQDW